MIKFISNTAKERFQNLIESPINFPESCPVCHGDIEIDESGLVHCINFDCPKKKEHRLDNALGILKIKLAGVAFIQAAVKDISCLADFFKLTDSYVKWAGGINGEKILQQIQSVLCKEIEVWQFLSLFDISKFGSRRLEQIKEAIRLENGQIFLNKERIVKTKGWTEDGFHRLNSALEVESLKKDIFECSKIFKVKNIIDHEKPVIENKIGPLSGLSFCFTGRCEGIGTRQQCEELVLQSGGQISLVKKGLNYLVSDNLNSTSSKAKKANQLGIKIISSFDLIKMIENSK